MNRLFFKTIITLAWLTLSWGGFANESLQFKHLTSTGGLSHNTVYAITQDYTGYMWLATRDGLNRFDGTHISVYYPPKDSMNRTVSSLFRMVFVAADRTLYTGTNDFLYRFDPIADKLLQVKLSQPTGKINTLENGPNGNLYLGCGRGLFLYNPGTGEVIQRLQRQCLSILKLNDNRFVIQSPAGISIIDSTGNTQITLAQVNQTYLHNFSGCFLRISDEAFYFGTFTSGLVQVNVKTGTFQNFQAENLRNPLEDNFIRAMAYDVSGNVWLGTENGIYIFDSNTHRFTSCNQQFSEEANGLNDKSVYALYFSRDNIMWAGTYFGGVNYVNLKYPKFQKIMPSSVAFGLKGKALSQIIGLSENELMIATEDAGIARYNKTNNQFTHIVHNNSHNSISSNNVHALLKDNTGKIWCGTFMAGLNVFSAEGNITKQYVNIPGDDHSLANNSVYSLLQSGFDHKIWIGTMNGINLYDPATGKLSGTSQPELSNVFAYHLFEDHLKNIWICTNNRGIFQYNPSTGALKYLNDDLKNIIGRQCIYGIEDSKYRLWFGFQESGMVMYDPKTNTIAGYNTDNGLQNSTVYSILEDNAGYIWFSTNKGLGRLNPQTGKINEFTQAHGLSANQFNFRSAYKDQNGMLYFGSVNGLTMFNPNEIIGEPKTMPFCVVQMTAANPKVKFGQEVIFSNNNYPDNITLRYEQNTFAISFTGINYLSAENNRYRCKLEGFDNGWHNLAQSTTATYTNIPPGHYRFKIEVNNADGLWISPETTLNITVKPPFYLTWLAYIVYFIIGIILLIFSRRFILFRQREKHKLELATIEKEKSIELTRQKLNFYTLISHELKTPLTLILASADKLLGRENSESDITFLTNIRRNSHRLLQLINQLIDFRKIETNDIKVKMAEGELIGFLHDIFKGYIPLFNEKRLTYSFGSSETELYAFFDGDKLMKIVSNLLTNAFTYAKMEGMVSFGIKLNHTQDTHQLQIIVQNTGKLLTHDQIANAFVLFDSSSDTKTLLSGSGIGLALVKNMVSLLEGTIHFTSTIEHGNMVTVVIPLALSDHSNILAEPLTANEHINSNMDPTFKETQSQEKPTLLIIEDSSELSQFLNDHFSANYIVKVAENGREALTLLTSVQPDIILSDVMMPEMDGLTFCKSLKNNLETSHIPIVMLSAKSAAEARIDALEAGADTFIAKPFEIQELSLLLRNMMRRRNIIKNNLVAGKTPSTAEDNMSIRDRSFINQLTQIVHNHLDDGALDVEFLTREAGISRTMLHVKLRKLANMSATEFINTLRLAEACKLLDGGVLTVSEVAYATGFNDPNYFSKLFKKLYRVSPSEYRQGLRSED